jgi:hypothetical protein
VLDYDADEGEEDEYYDDSSDGGKGEKSFSSSLSVFPPLFQLISSLFSL